MAAIAVGSYMTAPSDEDVLQQVVRHVRALTAMAEIPAANPRTNIREKRVMSVL